MTKRQDVGIYIEGSAPWTLPIRWVDESGDPVPSVRFSMASDGTTVIADDLTLDEAREIITTLARRLAEVTNDHP